jgi:hypothetical protein
MAVIMVTSPSGAARSPRLPAKVSVTQRIKRTGRATPRGYTQSRLVDV